MNELQWKYSHTNNPNPGEKRCSYLGFFSSLSPFEATCFLRQHKHPLDLKFPHRYDVQSIINLYANTSTNIYSYILCTMYMYWRGSVSFHKLVKRPTLLTFSDVAHANWVKNWNSNHYDEEKVCNNNIKFNTEFETNCEHQQWIDCERVLLLLFFFHWSTLSFSLRWS